MSVTPGPVATPLREPERARGRRPGGEDGVGVPDEQRPRTARFAREDRLDGVAEPAGRVGVPGHGAAEPREAIGRPGGHLVDPVAGVAAAVDVDEALEVGEQGRLRRGDPRAAARRARGRGEARSPPSAPGQSRTEVHPGSCGHGSRRPGPRRTGGSARCDTPRHGIRTGGGSRGRAGGRPDPATGQRLPTVPATPGFPAPRSAPPAGDLPAGPRRGHRPRRDVRAGGARRRGRPRLLGRRPDLDQRRRSVPSGEPVHALRLRTIIKII